VTQQYVKRQTGNYALLDLYFPQIELAVEVDEMHHEDDINKKNDLERQEAIFNSIKEDSDSSIIFLRIKEEIDGEQAMYADVEKNIQEAITAITARSKKYGSLVWDEDWLEKEHDDKFNKIKQKGRLDISDPIGFTRIQVTNEIFGLKKSKGFLQFGKSWYPVSEGAVIWFPHFTRNKRWANEIANNWTEIREKRIDGEDVLPDPEHHDANILRYTFAKYKNSFGVISYRYFGNFRFNKFIDNTFFYVRDTDNNFINLKSR
jgi:hypothetical protein